MKHHASLSGSLLMFMIFSLTTTLAKSGSKPTSDVVAIDMSVERSVLSLHEPVVLTLTITNGRRDPIQIDLGKDRKENFKIAITPPKGEKVYLPQLRKSGFGRTGNVTVSGGQSYLQKVVLNEWYSFAETGVYGIDVELGKPAIAAGNIVGGQQSFRATLEIGPRDQEALARGCEALASGVEASGSYERSAENALALSYVNDPVAVPYLARSLMANKLVEPIAIEGLERIGTPEAVRALGPALNMSTNHSSILAKSALARIQTRTADPEVRGEVARVMSQATSNQ
jgi:hypothetical protein